MARAGVFGPYEHGQRWRVVFRDERGAQTAGSYATKAEAEEVIRVTRAELAADSGDRTIQTAIEGYEMHLRRKGNKARSYTATLWRLRVFFRDTGAPLGSLTPKRCEALYEALTAQISPRTKRPLSVDSHRNMLAEAKTFLGWCVEQRWLRKNPAAAVKGVGRRRKGKAQLRIDEARAWLAAAHRLAAEHDGAVAALMSLLMGMRCGEIVSRETRDLDDEGRLLWIPDSKTEKGRRTLEVPEAVRGHLRRLAEKNADSGYLLGGRDKKPHTRDWPRKWVQRVCEAAGVPKVTAHGMRGLHSTLALQAGTSPRVVADSLGHESPTTTLTAYADREVVAQGAQRAALRVLEGKAAAGN